MLLRELLPSVLLLELFSGDFENFNMEGKGEGVEKVFIIKETHKIMYTTVYVYVPRHRIFFAAAVVVLLSFYQRKLLSLPLFKPQ